MEDLSNEKWVIPALKHMKEICLLYLEVGIMYIYMYMYMLGVPCCFALFVCLTLLASFFLPSHLSFKNMYAYGS